MRDVVGLVPVGVEGELHPQPPDRDEEEGEARERAQVRMVLERAGELVDPTGEHQVEEELDPAGVALLDAVPVRRPEGGGLIRIGRSGRCARCAAVAGWRGTAVVPGRCATAVVAGMRVLLLVLQCVLDGAGNGEGTAVRPGLLEGRVGGAVT